MGTPKFGTFDTDIRVEHTLFLNVLCESRIPRSFKKILFPPEGGSFRVYLWSHFEPWATVIYFHQNDFGCYLKDISVRPKSIEFIVGRLIEFEKEDPYGIIKNNAAG